MTIVRAPNFVLFFSKIRGVSRRPCAVWLSLIIHICLFINTMIHGKAINGCLFSLQTQSLSSLEGMQGVWWCTLTPPTPSKQSPSRQFLFCERQQILVSRETMAAGSILALIFYTAQSPRRRIQPSQLQSAHLLTRTQTHTYTLNFTHKHPHHFIHIHI